MEEQAFYKTIYSVVEELHDNSFGVGILYDMCSDKLHPWGHKNRLGDKLCFISRLHGHELREGYLKYAVHEIDGKQFCRHRKINEFGAVRDMLLDSERYKAFVQNISAINWQFAYDASKEDIERFKESLFAVLEFNDILKDAICRYDELYDQQCTRRDNIPFASTFLHFHRPEQFFTYNNDLRRGSTHFRDQNGCRIGEAIIDDEAKKQIEGICRNVLKSLHGDGILTDADIRSPKVEYLRMMGLQYAICCYIKEHSDKIDGLNQHPFPLISAEILTHVRRIKTDEEIEKIIEQLKPEMPLSALALYCEDAAELDQIAEAYMRRK